MRQVFPCQGLVVECLGQPPISSEMQPGTEVAPYLLPLLLLGFTHCLPESEGFESDPLSLQRSSVDLSKAPTRDGMRLQAIQFWYEERIG